MERWGGHRLAEAKQDTPTTKIEVLPIHGVNPEALTAFFRRGYGCAYLGDDSLRKKIQRSSHAVLLGDFDGDLNVAGAALIADKRILALATSPNTVHDHSRYESAVTLLRSCLEELSCQWLTIGQEYSRVQQAAQDAGLTRVSDPTLVQGLLAEAGEASNYDLHYDENGELLVARVTSEFRPDYEQQFWVHLPQED